LSDIGAPAYPRLSYNTTLSFAESFRPFVADHVTLLAKYDEEGKVFTGRLTKTTVPLPDTPLILTLPPH
jgi:hypothetical protein